MSSFRKQSTLKGVQRRFLAMEKPPVSPAAEVAFRQEMPPPGGFPTIDVSRQNPKWGPSSGKIYVATISLFLVTVWLQMEAFADRQYVFYSLAYSVGKSMIHCFLM